ncbi:MAG: META domain-containing protein [Gammaproteobacteria bacterium]|nr:META domain-containing protein [Gammaproteobacteria bacterium]
MSNASFLIILCTILLKSAYAIESVEMTGMYSYYADRGLFLECGQNKKRLPVAMEKDNQALERAYLNNRYQMGESLFVKLKAHFDRRPKMEGEEDEKVLMVDQFMSIHQQEKCSGVVPPSSLDNTYWKLVELKEVPLTNNTLWRDAMSQSSGEVRDIHFVIHQKNSVRGFLGCNRFSGTMDYTEQKIAFKSLITTKMMCPAQALENMMTKLLSQVDSYQIKGESLELYGTKNNKQYKLAKFIALYF